MVSIDIRHLREFRLSLTIERNEESRIAAKSCSAFSIYNKSIKSFIHRYLLKKPNQKKQVNNNFPKITDAMTHNCQRRFRTEKIEGKREHVQRRTWLGDWRIIIVG